MNETDLSIWVTQQSLATELNVTVQCVHNWIKRNKIQAQKIKGSRLTLVNRTSVILDDKRKNR